MVIEMLLNNDIKKKTQMILDFQHEINIIVYIIENKIKLIFNHFIKTKSQ
jgi:hypothetical protein